jgi:hypothetical protein
MEPTMAKPPTQMGKDAQQICCREPRVLKRQQRCQKPRRMRLERTLDTNGEQTNHQRLLLGHEPSREGVLRAAPDYAAYVTSHESVWTAFLGKSTTTLRERGIKPTSA